MNISIEQMREELKSLTKYHGAPRWAHRVDEMPDKQVIAIYKRMKEGGELQCKQ